MSKTNVERIANIKAQIEQLENLKKSYLKKQRADDRKARTHRLIERGAILESLIPGAEAFTGEQIKAFLQKTVATDTARKILDSFAVQGGEAPAEKPPWDRRADGAAVAAKIEETE